MGEILADVNEHIQQQTPPQHVLARVGSDPNWAGITRIVTIIVSIAAPVVGWLFVQMVNSVLDVQREQTRSIALINSYISGAQVGAANRDHRIDALDAVTKAEQHELDSHDHRITVLETYKAMQIEQQQYNKPVGVP